MLMCGIEEEDVDAVEFDAVDAGLGGQVEHGVEVDRRLGAGAALADEAGPHGVVKLGVVVLWLRHILLLKCVDHSVQNETGIPFRLTEKITSKGWKRKTSCHQESGRGGDSCHFAAEPYNLPPCTGARRTAPPSHNGSIKQKERNMPATGKITQVIGSTFDVEFPEDQLADDL